MLAQRLRRWPNIKTSLFQRVVFAGITQNSDHIWIISALWSSWHCTLCALNAFRVAPAPPSPHAPCLHCLSYCFHYLRMIPQSHQSTLILTLPLRPEKMGDLRQNLVKVYLRRPWWRSGECEGRVRVAKSYLECSPSGWNRFQPQIDRVQNRGTFLWTVINETSGRIIGSKI